jgi:stage IV sporulation protein FB
MFGINPTPFDVRLVAFHIPVRVHPSFWLGSILFGSNLSSSQLIFIWVVCSFVSILIHELGHALTAESFGWPTEIVMYFGGGLAISQHRYNNTPWRSIAVTFMGPAAGLLLYGLILGIDKAFGLSSFDVSPDKPHETWYFYHAISFLLFMNLYWSLLNLLPILPLDGGFILQSLCDAFHLRNGRSITLQVGAAASGAAAYYFFTQAKQPYAGMLMLMLCVQSIGELQRNRR